MDVIWTDNVLLQFDQLISHVTAGLSDKSMGGPVNWAFAP
jgi:hypothetical protein